MTEVTKKERWYYSSRVPGGQWVEGSSWPSVDTINDIMNRQVSSIKETLDRRIIHEVITTESTVIRMEKASGNDT